jgi:hypothetical protein
MRGPWGALRGFGKKQTASSHSKRGLHGSATQKVLRPKKAARLHKHEMHPGSPAAQSQHMFRGERNNPKRCAACGLGRQAKRHQALR